MLMATILILTDFQDNFPYHYPDWFYALFVISVVFFASSLFLSRYLKKRKEKNYAKTHRTKSNKPKKHKKLLDKCEKKGYIYLGCFIISGKPCYLILDELFRHIQVIGGTGAGKTTSVIYTILLQYIKLGYGVIFIDAKADYRTAQTVYWFCKQAGREDDFMMFSLTDPELSNTYNPLCLGNATQKKDKIISSIDFTEPFYRDECESCAQLLFSDLELANKQGKNLPVSLPALYEYLENPPKELPRFRRFFYDHRNNIFNLQNEIRLLCETPFSHLFLGDEINLLDAYLKGKIVYFAINTSLYQETAIRLGKIITGDINALCGTLQGMTERHPFGVIIDEYAKFGTQGFAHTLSQGRNVKFMTLISHQSLADLEAIDKTHPSKIRDNTHTRIVLGDPDPELSSQFSDEIGTYPTIQKTRQIKRGFLFDIPTGLGTERNVREYCLHPDELKNMKMGQAAVITPHDFGIIWLSYTEPNVSQVKLPQKEKPENTRLSEERQYETKTPDEF